MNCLNCGTENDDTLVRCPRCGASLPRGSAAPANEDDPGLKYVIPIGRSWVAIVAGYLGLFALCVFPAPLALLAGILAVRHIRQNPEKLGMGRAVFGIVAGAIGTLMLIGWVFLVALHPKP